MSGFSEEVENTSTETEDYESIQVVVVADFFASELTGGAELSTQALVDASPFTTKLIKSEAVDLKTESARGVPLLEVDEVPACDLLCLKGCWEVQTSLLLHTKKASFVC